MRYFKKIVGEKVYLSPINIDDVEKYTEWINDLEVSINLGNASDIYSLEKEKEILEKISKEGYNFAIVDLNKDELIGNCGLMDIDMRNRRAELGIFIGNKNYWSKGFGSETINLLLEYGFNILNLNNILLRVYSFNKRAISCYKKCGFKEIGRRRESYIVGNKRYDDIYMDILASEFRGKIHKLINEEG
ncbi:GNAT family N-acetyltransferase [Clostridium sp. D2Q-14]|uniref:GNAT family N-acetyltransferase n=1 Tax=Anaeromonas gelatinilytica TaxID=2683194 RepID=UPI00193B8F75|nr:GNAT family protein [Anaeromonas gelatinilytica]MBS4535714.1 GNAT family N-acetyltransferase [Anaeromonas gelatinilytica]